jgi:hypothetical protein
VVQHGAKEYAAGAAKSIVAILVGIAKNPSYSDCNKIRSILCANIRSVFSRAPRLGSPIPWFTARLGIAPMAPSLCPSET